MNIVVINAYGRSNRGDAVLLDECLAAVKQVLAPKKLAVLCFDCEGLSADAENAVAYYERLGNADGSNFRPLRKLIRLLMAWLSVLLSCSSLAALLPKKQRDGLAALKQADLVISAPGGYLHDTNAAYWIALFHIYLAVALNKKVVLAPQSLGPIRGRIGRLISKKVLSGVKAICVREGYSETFVKTLIGGCSSVVRCGDAAFWNSDVLNVDSVVQDELEELGVSPSDRIFGVSVVGWSYPSSDSPEDDRRQYIDGMGRILNWASSKGMVPVIFNQVSEDIPEAIAVAEVAKCRVVVDRKSRSPSELRAIMARSILFLGTRFHSCIFALMAGRPVFAICYLPKTKWIMEDLGLSGRHTPIEKFDPEVVIEQLEKDLDDLKFAECATSAAVVQYKKSYSPLERVLVNFAAV